MDNTLKKLVSFKEKTYGDWWLENDLHLDKGYLLSNRVIKHYLNIRYKYFTF